jgi:hypothetical protein
MANRIHLSISHLCDDEERLVRDAFASNSIALLGPQVDMLDEEYAEIDRESVRAFVRSLVSICGPGNFPWRRVAPKSTILHLDGDDSFF